MSLERKAGLFTLLALAALLVSIIILRGGLPVWERGYDLRVRVANAGGMTIGAPVQMSGIKIGEVRRLDHTPELRALITVRIATEKTVVPTGSRFSITTAGLLGDRFITITPGPATAPPLVPGATVDGVDPFTVDELLARVVAVARQAEEALANINRLIGDPALPGALSETVRNARDATAVMRRAADNVERTTRTLDRSISREVPIIAQQLRAMATDLAEAARETRMLVHEVSAEGETARQIRETVGAVQRATQRIDKMAADLSGVINEQQVRAVRASLAEAQSAITEARQGVAEIRQGVAEARGVIGRADRVVERVGRIIPDQPDLSGLRSGYRLDYDLWFAGGRVGHDIRFTLLPNAPRRYIFSWRDVGNANRIGLQLGSQAGDTSLLYRYGLIDGQPGVGVDYGVAPGPVYSLDLYNLNQLTLNVYATYFFQRDWGITLRGLSLLNQPVLGLGYFRRF